MNQTEDKKMCKIAKYKERVGAVPAKSALYQQTYPERNMSQLKRMLDIHHGRDRGEKDLSSSRTILHDV